MRALARRERGGAATREIAIIGSGFAGLGMAIRLKQAGVDSFTIYEQASGLGGTWRDNTYPGAACDIPSHLYSFSFEPFPEWSATYGQQREILDYLEHCADKYRVRDHIQFEAEVVRAEYDAGEARWTLTFADGASRSSDILVSGTGGLSRPKLPELPGRDRFAGDSFHTARWRHECELAGKRVAVIGTGASAIQVIPNIAPVVKQLYVFQRTPAWVLPKEDRPIPERERRRFRRMPLLQRWQRAKQYWHQELRGIALFGAPSVLRLLEKRARRHIENEVTDPVLRAQLTPDYTMGCKRILLANDYYPALQRDNVELIPVAVSALDETGVVDADGVRREVDVVVYCTGFTAADDFAAFPIVGGDGRDLNEAWHRGAEAYLGTCVAGFPNFFVLVGPNTGLGHNSMVFIIESQIRYVMSALGALERRGARFLDVRAEVQREYNQRLQERLQGTVWNSGCQSWYRDADGKITALWPGLSAEFRARTRAINPRHYRFG